MTAHHHPAAPTAGTQRRAARVALWIPGLLVAVGAAVATAHGLYEVARAASTPPVIAGLYPLITDGLALVAYAATARLSGSGRRYAWSVVVLAAGLSGLAQASYLAQTVHTAPTALRFGIGAWPAIAAAIVAHLLYLIAHADRPGTTTHSTAEPDQATEPAAARGTDAATAADPAECPTVLLPPVHPERVQPSSVQTGPGQPAPVRPDGVRPGTEQPTVVQPEQPESVQPANVHPTPSNPERPGSARDRADRAAHQHLARHGALPTVSVLMDAAEVSRGTAGEALKALRAQPAPLHLVPEDDHQEAQS